MSSSDLPDRLEPWALRIIEGLEARASEGRRHIRRAAAGPLRVRHTYVPGSSHATLADGLTGCPGPHDPEVTIHSVQLDLEEHVPDPPPWSDVDFDDYDRPEGLEDSPWRLSWNRATGDVRCYHRDWRVGLFITPGTVQSWEFSSPMLPFWHWAAAAQGAAMVHGGTSGTPEAMGIVGGPSGAGKSTTVLLGMHAGLRTCGDDYVWLQPDSDGPQVWATFRTIKTVADSPLRPPVSERTSEEGTVRKQIHWVPAEVLLPRATLRLAWVLREPDAATCPPGRIDALSALLPSTLLRVNGDHAVVAAVLREVLDGVQVRSLQRDGDLEAVARTLARDCAELGVSV